MNINAKCGCGASLEIAPSSAGYNQSYSEDQRARAEREAVAEAFKLWTERHSTCSQRSPTWPMPMPWTVPEPMVTSHATDTGTAAETPLNPSNGSPE